MKARLEFDIEAPTREVAHERLAQFADMIFDEPDVDLVGASLSEESLATYNLVLTGPSTPVILASLPVWLAEAEENLNDLLPDGYRVEIREGSSDERS